MCAAQFGNRIGIAQHTGDARECLQVIRAGILRREKQKNKIDGLIVQRLEIDRGFQTSENSGYFVDVRQLAVRNGNAIAHPGRTEALTLENCFENFTLRETGQFRSLFRQNLQKLFFGAGFQRRIIAPG